MSAKTLFKDKWVNYILVLQQTICEALEQVDGKAKFVTDEWQRAGGRGGGGKTRVISKGSVFEKGGVNTSVVYGEVSEAMRKQLGINTDHNEAKPRAEGWFACGLSLVIHPFNPFVPTVHANWRYFELYDKEEKVCDQWFGGGMDLTPYYLFEEDAIHFHRTIKKAMQPFGEKLYPEYKKWCDEYFNNAHRGFEMRGVGGVFYDHLKPDEKMNLDQLFQFQQANGNSFLEAYLPIVEKRKGHPFTDQNKYWQEIRRGRYVEFNLIHDRGTLFGLKSGGRIESILMSLPPTVRFDYNYQPEEESEEWKLLEVCKHPVNWV